MTVDKGRSKFKIQHMLNNGNKAVAVAKPKVRIIRTVALENIEEMRRRQGIEDVELRQKIRGLARGDFVRLTFLSGQQEPRAETLVIRITSVRGCTFRGKLAGAASAKTRSLRPGTTVVFTTDHIHSLLKEGPAHEH
jgi:hypothetical protein